MPESLRILILEDDRTDAELAQFELQEAGFAFTSKVVINESDFVHELQEFSPDLIISDYDLPQYNGALALAEAKSKCPDTPFVLVSGAVSEDRAIEILTQGAKDYVLKNRLRQRLVPAVRRALAEADEHRARKQAEEALREAHRTLEERVKIRTEELEAEIAARKKTEEELRKSEARFKAQYQGNPMPTFTWRMKDGAFFLGDYNEATKILTNGEVEKYINRKADEMYGERPDVLEYLHRCYMEKGILQKEFKSEHFMPGRIIATTFAFVPPDLVMVHAGDITERKQAEEDRKKLIEELREALSQVKTLSGLLPICASCKKIRDDKGYWNQIEYYIKEHSDAEFSHSICPECAEKLYPEFCKKIH
ncbi:MAG: hypothetical protein CSYNP_02797 [Syntrophus sp. SKADARSKE-3]|nr:hypothetical protein [Syntrophus sp. SKADARSKE-3]